MCDQQSLISACAYGQSDQSLCTSLEYSMTVKLLTEHLLEVLHLTGSCTGSSKSTLVKMPLCWKSNVTASLILAYIKFATHIHNVWSSDYFKNFARFVSMRLLEEFVHMQEFLCSQGPKFIFAPKFLFAHR